MLPEKMEYIFLHAILSFLVVHVYMTTTGHAIFAHIKAMITGWEDIQEGEFEDWERN